MHNTALLISKIINIKISSLEYTEIYFVLNHLRNVYFLLQAFFSVGSGNTGYLIKDPLFSKHAPLVFGKYFHFNYYIHKVLLNVNVDIKKK